MKILVAGFSVRHIACSAARAGHTVIAADCFLDLDLEACASDMALMERNDQDEAERSLEVLMERFSPDAIVLGPGLEEVTVKGVRTLNNPSPKAALVSDKFWLACWLEKRGFPFIKTQLYAGSIDYPMIIKPRKGAGGVGCRLARSLDDLGLEDGMIIQKMVEGKPVSVSVIANGREARAVAVNEQIIGASWAGAEEFRYSGNITPLEPGCYGLAAMAEEIIADLGLVGSNGVDFMLTESGPVVVEVNPRFQGSLDTVELSTGQNVFQAHLESFEGLLPEWSAPADIAAAATAATADAAPRTAGRIIVYAKRDLKVALRLQLEGVTDIPRPGSLIRKGDPIASILAMGGSRAAVLKQLMDRTAELQRVLYGE